MLERKVPSEYQGDTSDKHPELPLAKQASQEKKKERKRKKDEKETSAKSAVASGKELEWLIIWAFSCFAGLSVFGFVREQFWILRCPPCCKDK